MTNETIDRALANSGASVGQYVVLDPMGRLVRVADAIGSFSATTFQRTASGWARVC